MNLALLPLRIVAWLALWLLALLVTLGYAYAAERWPRAADRFFDAAARLSSKALLAAAGFRVTVGESGARDVCTTLVVANHVAVYDPWALMAACGPLAFVARQGLFDIAVVGRVLRAVGAVGVDRSVAGSNGACAAIERHVSHGGRWPLLVFPEGTTTTGRGLLQFRSGAFIAGKPATPVVLRYSSPSGFDLAYVDNQNTARGVFGHFCRCLLERGKTLDVRVLPPVSAAPGDDAAAHAARVRDAMLEVLSGGADWRDWDNRRMRQAWYGGSADSQD